MSQKRLLLSFSLILLAALQPARLGAAKEPGCSSQNAQQTPPAKTTEPRVGQAPPTLEQILDKYVQAIGDKAALQAPTSRVMKGTIEAPAIDAEGAIEIYAKAPNKQLTEVALEVAGNPRTGFNGDTAWQEEYGEAKAGNRLIAQLTGQKSAEIFPASETEYFYRVTEAQITFRRNDNGDVTGLHLS